MRTIDKMMRFFAKRANKPTDLVTQLGFRLSSAKWLQLPHRWTCQSSPTGGRQRKNQNQRSPPRARIRWRISPIKCENVH